MWGLVRTQKLSNYTKGNAHSNKEQYIYENYNINNMVLNKKTHNINNK